MADETDNFALEAETDNVTPSEDDTPNDWDYYDPEEDTVGVTEEDGTEVEAGETDEQPEPEDSEEEQEEDPTAEADPLTLEDDAKIQIGDEVLSFADLRAQRMMQADYSRKTQEVANERSKVSELASQLESVTQTFADHLGQLVTPAPDRQLAMTDPARYTAQKAQHEADLAQVEALIEMGMKPKQVGEVLSSEEQQKRAQQESRLLAEKVPEMQSLKGREAFFKEVSEVGQQFGFAMEELQGITDHRMFVVLQAAAKGLKSDKAKEAVKAKAQKAPPAAPQKPGQGAKRADRNKAAMTKLARTGSIKDALAIDFD